MCIRDRKSRAEKKKKEKKEKKREKKSEKKEKKAQPLPGADPSLADFLDSSSSESESESDDSGDSDGDASKSTKSKRKARKGREALVIALFSRELVREDPTILVSLRDDEHGALDHAEREFEELDPSAKKKWIREAQNAIAAQAAEINRQVPGLVPGPNSGTLSSSPSSSGGSSSSSSSSAAAAVAGPPIHVQLSPDCQDLALPTYIKVGVVQWDDADIVYKATHYATKTVKGKYRSIWPRVRKCCKYPDTLVNRLAMNPGWHPSCRAEHIATKQSLIDALAEKERTGEWGPLRWRNQGRK